LLLGAIEALFLIAQDDYFEGDWDELIEVTTEALQLCEEFGDTLLSAPGRLLRALVDAARGNVAADLAAEKLLSCAGREDGSEPPCLLHTTTTLDGHR